MQTAGRMTLDATQPCEASFLLPKPATKCLLHVLKGDHGQWPACLQHRTLQKYLSFESVHVTVFEIIKLNKKSYSANSVSEAGPSPISLPLETQDHAGVSQHK